MNGEDIVTELGTRFIKSYSAKKDRQKSTPLTSYTAQEQTILLSMGTEPIHIDALVSMTSIDVSSLLVHLFELEEKTAIVQQPGQLFQKKVFNL